MNTYTFCQQLISAVWLLLFWSGTALAQEDFSEWLEMLRDEAKAAGISDNTASVALGQIAFLPDTIKLDQSQPEFVRPFIEYYLKRVDQRKIKKGRELLAQHATLLDTIQAQYGVPKEILVAFWGMETQYGAYQGKVDILSTLATLAYEGRRADFFKGQLLDAMLMLEKGHVGLEQFQGSWAGAYGNMQFMPTTFMFYAVDGDGDERVDIANSLPDTFASAANYLSRVGWLANEPAMIEVQLPNDFDWQLAQLSLRKSTSEWAALGVRAMFPSIPPARLQANSQKSVGHVSNADERDGRGDLQTALAGLPSVSGQAAILLPQGWLGPAFMVFDNFDVVMHWNRSVNYALSVAQLAKRLKGEARIVGGQLAEGGALSFQQMQDLQALLNARGFDAGSPDGLPGIKTQEAVRAYQLSKRLPADGYAGPTLYQTLLSQP